MGTPDDYLTILRTLRQQEFTKVYGNPAPTPIAPQSKPSTSPLEPTTLYEYVGQENVKSLVRIMLSASKTEGRAFPNVILNGDSGLGKTTLAKIIIRELSGAYTFTDGSAANKLPAASFVGYFVIDEIHNLNPEICDILNVRLDAGLVNILGCTTQLGSLPKPFRSRFRQLNLESYTVEDMQQILRGVIIKKGILIDARELMELSKRSRLSPRTGKSYLSLIFDILSAEHKTRIDATILQRAFDYLGLDEDGLLPRDRQYLSVLPSERSVGLQYLSARLSIDPNTIEEEIEPYLMQRGLIDRNPRGRSKVGPEEDAIGRLFGG